MVQVSRSFELLGVAIGSDDFIHQHTVERDAQAGDLLDALGELPDPQVGLRLLRACGGFACLVHSMRCNPSVPQQTALSLDMFDGMVRRSFGDLTGVHPNGLQWQQAGLGFAYGGLGLRSTSPAAYLASLEPPCSQPLTSMPASAWTLLKPPLKLLLLCPLSTTAFPLGRLLLWRRPWLPPNTTFLTAWILLWDEQLLQASLVSRATLRSEASQEPGLPYSGPHWQSADGTSPIRGRTPSSTRYS